MRVDLIRRVILAIREVIVYHLLSKFIANYFELGFTSLMQGTRFCWLPFCLNLLPLSLSNVTLAENSRKSN